jgi:hypothetical protein
MTQNSEHYRNYGRCYGSRAGGVRKLGGVARVSTKIMLAGFFEASFGFEENIVVWDEFTYGEPCG